MAGRRQDLEELGARHLTRERGGGGDEWDEGLGGVTVC